MALFRQKCQCLAHRRWSGWKENHNLYILSVLLLNIKWQISDFQCCGQVSYFRTNALGYFRPKLYSHLKLWNEHRQSVGWDKKPGVRHVNILLMDMTIFYYGVKKGSTAVAIRDTRQPFWIVLDNLSLHGLDQLNALLWVPTWEPWRIHTSHSGCVLHVYHKRDYKYIYLIAINQIHGWPSTQPGTCTQPCPIVHTAVPGENNEHGCVYLRCRAVCKLPDCVEGHPWNSPVHCTYWVQLCPCILSDQVGIYSLKIWTIECINT